MVLSMDRWVGKVAVITGASSGIGAGVAEQLVEQGLKVAALARRKDRLETLAKKLSGKKGKLYPVLTDISKEEEILKAFKWIKDNLGPVHILVNSAGAASGGFITEGNAEDWEHVFRINVIALGIATREAVKDMRANNVAGHIVNINGLTGIELPAYVGFGMYPMSKYAATALAETVRLEINSLKLKIKITNVSPGAVDTEFVPSYLDVQKMRNESKILAAEEIVDAVVYALSTPPHVQIQQLTIRPIFDVMLDL